MSLARASRVVGSAAAATLLAAGLGACTGGTGPVAYNSWATRTRINRITTTIMQQHGMPLNDGLVGCIGPHPGPGFAAGKTAAEGIVCRNTVTDEPPSDVQSTFVPSTAPRRGHCPGTLTITLSGSSTSDITVTTRHLDPCR